MKYKTYEEIASVKLVSYTQPAEEYKNLIDGDKTLTNEISYCARVSNPNNQENTATANKLLKYMLDHKHYSPFQMVNICLEITTTRDIGRQILRHASAAFQEFSQRYADPSKELEFCLRKPRLQGLSNRQSSTDLDNGDSRIENWYFCQERILDGVITDYKHAIDNGVAKEVARVILPEGLTVTRMYMNAPVRTWIHYIELRTQPETQEEHRIIANLAAEEVAKVFPMISDFVTK